MHLPNWTQSVRSGTTLDQVAAKEILDLLLQDKVSTEEKVEFLIALTARGETADEIAFFALALRDLAKPFLISDEIRKEGFIDLCGTGGDGRNTFNISTCASFVIAAAGVKVVKHGNRGITSKSGGFDVLEALGIKIDLSPDQALQSLKSNDLCFLFAQHYHPAFKKLAPLRKEVAARKSRTIFNLVGPLLNPALPPFQLVGVPHLDLPEKYIQALSKMGIRRGAVVCGRTETGEAMDELSTLSKSDWWEWNQGQFKNQKISPENFSFQKGKASELEVSNAQESAKIIIDILESKDQSVRRDMVALNAAGGLFLSDKVKTLEAGINLALEILASGKAWEKLQQVVEVTSRFKN
ncbi:MAG: anthranilate phosphoribosyltransferase [Verrucomicrobiia bacterium]